MNPPVSSPTSGKGTEPDPFESFVRSPSLDAIDRTLLAALLRYVPSERGATLAQLHAAFGNPGDPTHRLITDRLEKAGALRSLDLVECAPDAQPFKCYYRLARWAIDVLSGIEPSDPAPSEDVLFDEFDEAMENLGRHVTSEYERVTAWHAAVPQGPGWSRTRFLAREARRAVDRLRRLGKSGFARGLRVLVLTPRQEAVQAITIFTKPRTWTMNIGFFHSFVEAYAGAPTSWEELTEKGSVRPS